MDILTNKSGKQYDYMSRYAAAYTYYNTMDDKYMYGLMLDLDTTTSYVLHKLKPSDTLDYLAKYYYGRPDYFWVIAEFNKIEDPFIRLLDYFTEIKIPTLSTLKYRS